MERHVKERLVGAAVLMAAAVILIPEMLSGPDREPAPEAVRTTNENGIKTYTIDLGDASASTQKVDVQSAPPQEPAAAPDPSSSPPSAPAESDQTFPESGVPATSATPSSSTEASQPSERNLPKPDREPAVTRNESASAQPSVPPRAPQEGSAPRTLASEPAVPTSRGWAVQLGSFSNRDSAERLAREFQAERYDAFVMPVKSGAATLYRVRLGPMKDRSAAEEALKRAKVKVSGAAVVAHP